MIFGNVLTVTVRGAIACRGIIITSQGSLEAASPRSPDTHVAPRSGGWLFAFYLILTRLSSHAIRSMITQTTITVAQFHLAMSQSNSDR